MTQRLPRGNKMYDKKIFFFESCTIYFDELSSDTIAKNSMHCHFGKYFQVTEQRLPKLLYQVFFLGLVYVFDTVIGI